jgi:hypothetical protein
MRARGAFLQHKTTQKEWWGRNRAIRHDSGHLCSRRAFREDTALGTFRRRRGVFPNQANSPRCKAKKGLIFENAGPRAFE